MFKSDRVPLSPTASRRILQNPFGHLDIGMAIEKRRDVAVRYLWLRKGRSPWLRAPVAVILIVFSWLLTLHPTASGRTHAAYGGVYVPISILWLWQVDQIVPTRQYLRSAWRYVSPAWQRSFSRRARQ